MLCVALRMVAIIRQPTPTMPELSTERAVTPWAISLGLLFVVVVRSGFTVIHPLRESIAGTLLFVFISTVALVVKVVLIPALLMLSLWMLDAPWAVAHFVGLYGSAFRLLFLLAFACGVGQTMLF